MKIKLPQTLRAALLASFALACPVTTSLATGSLIVAMSASYTHAEEYTITDSSSASTARDSTEDDTIVINMVHDSSATKNDNYLPNATTTDVSYTASTITIENMDISNGYGSGLSSSKLASFYFNGTVVGDGDINFYNWSSSACYQEYIFTGNLSNYSGDITSGKADNVSAATYSGGLYLTFTGTSSTAASGTGNIYLKGSSGESITYDYADDTTISNESIVAPTINLGTSTGYTYAYANYMLASNITVETLNILMTNNAYVMSGYTLNVTDINFGNNTDIYNYGTINLSGTASYNTGEGIYNYGEFNILSGASVTGPIMNYGGLNINSGASTSAALNNYDTINIAAGSSVSGYINNYSDGTLVLESGASITASSGLKIYLDGTLVINDASQIIINDSSAFTLSSNVIFDLSNVADDWVLSDGTYTFQLLGDSNGNSSYDISSLSSENFMGLNDFGTYTFNSDGSITYDLGDVNILCYKGESSFNWGTEESSVMFTNAATGSEQIFSDGVALSIEVNAQATLTSNVETNLLTIDGVEFTLIGDSYKLNALQISFAGDGVLILTDDSLDKQTLIGSSGSTAGTVQFDATNSSTVFNYGEQLKNFDGQVIINSGTLNLSLDADKTISFTKLTVNDGALLISAVLDMGDIVLNGGTSTLNGNITADSLSTTGGTNSLSGYITLGSLNYDGGSLELGGTIKLSSMSLSSDGTITLSDNATLNLADSSASWIKLDYDLSFSLGSGASMDIDETFWTRGDITFSLSDSSQSASVDINQLLVGYSVGSSTVTIGEGVTLTISGSTLKSSGTNSSFIVGGHSEGGNVDVYGTLVLNSGIMNYSGDGSIDVLNGGTIVLNAGLAAEVAGDSLSLNIESGATLSLGNQDDSSVDYGTVMTINIMDGASIIDNGVESTTTLNATLHYESGASINLASSGEGQTLLIGMNLSGESISANIQGEGTVEISAGASLVNLSVETGSTLNLSSNITATNISIASGSSIKVNTALNLGTSASITNEGTLALNEGSTLTISQGQSLSLAGSISLTEAGQIINDGTLSLTDDFIFDLSALLDRAWAYDIDTGTYSLTLIAGEEGYDLSNFDVSTNLSGFDTSDKDISFNSDGTLSYILSNLAYQRGGELTLQVGSSLSNADGSKEVLYTDGASIYFTTANSQVSLGEDIRSSLWEVYDVTMQLTGNSFTLTADHITLNGTACLILTDDALSQDLRILQAVDASSEVIIALTDDKATLNYALQLSEYTGGITIKSGTLNLISEDIAGYNFGAITINGSHLLISGSSTARDLDLSAGGTITLIDGSSLTIGDGATGDSSDAYTDNLLKHTGDITINLGSDALLDQNVRLRLDTGVALTINATSDAADAGNATYRINELLLRYSSTGDMETSVSIGAGTELEIAGTTTAADDANSSFIISGDSMGSSLITVEGQLTINSGIVSMGGSSNVINVADGGILLANTGIVAYDSSDSAVEIELNMAEGSTLLLGNQVTTDDHSDAISVNMASNTTIGTNGIDSKVYSYTSFNWEDGGSYTFDVATKNELNMMQAIELSNSTITVTGGGSTYFQGGLIADAIIVQESGTAGFGGESRVTQITGGDDGGSISIIYSSTDSHSLSIGSATYQANSSSNSISIDEGGSLTESSANKISTTGVTINLENDMQLTESTFGQNTVVNLAEDATLSVGDNITITSANSEGASIDVSTTSSGKVAALSDDTLSYVTFDNANIVLTSDSDENSLTVERIYTSDSCQLTIASGSSISIGSFTYLYGVTVIEADAQVNISNGFYVYNDFYIGENASVTMSGNFNSGSNIYIAAGATLETTSVGFYSSATLYLDGGTLLMNDKSRWIYSDIVISNSGSAMTGTTTTLTFASDISYTNAWVGSEDWTLNLDGNTKITINSAFAIDFTVNGEATLDVGSYVIFSNVANDVSGSLSAGDVTGVISDDYELVWTYEGGNIILTVSDPSVLIWDNDNEQWVTAAGTVVEPSESSSLSFETDSISAGIAQLSEDCYATSIDINGNADVNIAGDVILSSSSSIAKTGEGNATIGVQLYATDGIHIEAGSLILSETGSINSDTSIAQDASLQAGSITISGSQDGANITINDAGNIIVDQVQGSQITAATISVNGIGTIQDSTLTSCQIELASSSSLTLTNITLSADSSIRSATTTWTRSLDSNSSELYLTGANTIEVSVEGGSLNISDNVYSILSLEGVESLSVEGSLTINIILSEDELMSFNSAYNNEEGITFIIASNVDSYELTELTIMINNATIYSGTGDYSDGLVSASLFGSTLIPEPSTATLSLLALAGLLARRRRRQA